MNTKNKSTSLYQPCIKVRFITYGNEFNQASGYFFINAPFWMGYEHSYRLKRMFFICTRRQVWTASLGTFSLCHQNPRKSLLLFGGIHITEGCPQKWIMTLSNLSCGFLHIQACKPLPHQQSWGIQCKPGNILSGSEPEQLENHE